MSTLCLLNLERRVLKSPTMIVDCLCVLSGISFLLCVFWSSVTKCTHIQYTMFSWWTDPFYHYKILLLFLEIFLALKSTWSDINRAKQAIFWFIFAWYIFFQPFTYTLSVSLYLVNVGSTLIFLFDLTITKMPFIWSFQAIYIQCDYCRGRFQYVDILLVLSGFICFIFLFSVFFWSCDFF